MKKFLVIILIVSSISILYVFQQARLLEYSYDINSRNRSLALLIDQNRNLRYNIAKLERPGRLEEVLLVKEDMKDLYAPTDCFKIKIAKQLPGSREDMVPPGPFIRAGRALLGMFSLSSEAVANEMLSE
ncbi:MAG: hypothetical protein HQ572_01690 [Candidatus Omnitrophica bacterium]|nr:hypothetical protein [Candidatus Omnitrophota bacterium]